MRRFVGYFFQGFLYVAPLGVTGFVIYKIFSFVDTPLRQIQRLFLPEQIPGLGVLTTVVVLTALGWLGSTILARPVRAFIRSALERAPLLAMIEGAVRDLLTALFAKRRRFRQPVLVLVNPVSELEKVGFITEEDLRALGVAGKVAVYFPHSYNFSGELFIVPRERVRPVGISAQEAMKFIVSGGLINLGDHAEGSPLPGEREHLQVACGIVERDGRVLAAQRGAAMSMPLRWEFPGGKMRPGESPEDCLRRELREELGVTVAVGGALPAVTHAYPSFTVTLHPRRCTILSGSVVLHEHAAVTWLSPGELRALDWTEADRPVIEAYLAPGAAAP